MATDPGWGEAFNKPRFTNDNNHGLVVRVDFGQTSVLVTGDLEQPAIKDMLKRYADTGLLDVDLYVVGHYGSPNGITREWVEAMSSDLAAINVGKPDHDAQFCALAFGQPGHEIIDMLEAGASGTRDRSRRDPPRSCTIKRKRVAASRIPVRILLVVDPGAHEVDDWDELSADLAAISCGCEAQTPARHTASRRRECVR